MRAALAFAFCLVAACGPERPPPPPSTFDGLPVTGSLDDALKAGFTRCIEDTTELRCRRNGVMFMGHGPFNAAVDMVGSDGSGGFDHLILWHDRDQNALFAIGKDLRKQGWRTCYTGSHHRGDQAIYTRPDMRVTLSMDLSYWGKRRLRVIPQPGPPPATC